MLQNEKKFQEKKIENLDKLINLTSLSLHDVPIKKLENLNEVVNLKKLNFYNVKLL